MSRPGVSPGVLILVSPGLLSVYLPRTSCSFLRSLMTQMERLAARLEKRASPQLKHALADVRRDLRKVVGKTARQVLN